MKTENRIEMAKAAAVKGARGEVRDGACSVLRDEGTQMDSKSGRGTELACPASHSKTWRDSNDPLQSPVQNADGFWMLSFAGRCAALPQHQGLFYVKYLLANPHAAPIPAAELAAEVFERFGDHDDFRPEVTWRRRENSRLAKILLRKQRRLEAIVDREDEDDFVRLEALRELMVLDQLKRIYFSEIAREAKNAGEIVSETLRELHAMLAGAVDTRGNPQRVVRDFAMHLLHYVLMPSNRVSAKEGVKLFVYRPAVEGN